LRGLTGLARRIEDLNAVILQRTAEEKTIAVFPVLAGILAEPISLRFAELSSQPRSVEAILREKLEPQTHVAAAHPPLEERMESSATPEDSGERHRAQYGLHRAPPDLPEHLALVARWFYSKPREGEIFFREADWPYRRMLRACGRLLDREPPPPDTPAPSPPSG
jgi:hypothetical protein